MILSGFRGSTLSLGLALANQFDIGLYDELENLSTEKMSKRKSVEDVKDVNTGKITRFFF